MGLRAQKQTFSLNVDFCANTGDYRLPFAAFVLERKEEAFGIRLLRDKNFYER